MSKYFKMSEFTESITAKKWGIDNTPTKKQKENIEVLMDIMDIVRAKLNKPVRINSGFRCYKLNKKVGGVGNSIHMSGSACDIKFEGINEKTAKELFNFIKKSIPQITTGIYYPVYKGIRTRPFIHLDLRPREDSPAFMYKNEKNKYLYFDITK